MDTVLEGEEEKQFNTRNDFVAGMHGVEYG
jgi:hypothetical protein